MHVPARHQDRSPHHGARYVRTPSHANLLLVFATFVFKGQLSSPGTRCEHVLLLSPFPPKKSGETNWQAEIHILLLLVERLLRHQESPNLDDVAWLERIGMQVIKAKDIIDPEIYHARTCHPYPTIKCYSPWHLKGVLDFAAAMSACAGTKAPYTIILEDDVSNNRTTSPALHRNTTPTYATVHTHTRTCTCTHVLCCHTSK